MIKVKEGVAAMFMSGVKSLLLFFLGLFCLSYTTAMSQSLHPNIIVIMTDDQDEGPLFAMPHTMAFLADGGTKFINSFVNVPTCGPSRASFLTGQYVHNHGVKNNSVQSYRAYRRRDDDTLPVWLQDAGYKTALIGKYINGYAELDPVPPGWNEWDVSVSGTHYYNYTLNENGKLVSYLDKPQDYNTDVIADKAVGFIETNVSSPFFMLITPKAPHRDGKYPPLPALRDAGKFNTLNLPKTANFNEKDVSDKPQFIRDLPLLTVDIIKTIAVNYRRREESLIAVDDMIKRIRLTLMSHNLLQNTIVVLSSDNGFLQGNHRFFGKGVVYGEGIRVPLVMRGPGIPHNERRQQLVTNLDLTSTILDWAGVLAKHQAQLDGRSLLPVLKNKFIKWRKAFLTERFTVDTPRGFIALRTSTYIYAEHVTSTSTERELYDLVLDPYELRNKSGVPSYLPIFRSLRKMLHALSTCAGANCWVGQ